MVCVFHSQSLPNKVIKLSRAKKSKNKKCNRDHNGGNRFPVKVIEGNNLCVKEQSCSDCEKQKPNHPSYNLQRRERLQLLTNVLMLIVATLALLIYKEQLETTQTDERAWLRVDLVNQTKKTNSAVVVDPSKPLSAHITVTNIGKTAAKAIYIDACMEILDRAQPAHIEWMSRCYTRAHYREETGMLFPSGNISDAYMQKVDQNLIPSSPTPDQSKRFAAGQE